MGKFIGYSLIIIIIIYLLYTPPVRHAFYDLKVFIQNSVDNVGSITEDKSEKNLEDYNKCLGTPIVINKDSKTSFFPNSNKREVILPTEKECREWFINGNDINPPVISEVKRIIAEQEALDD